MKKQFLLFAILLTVGYAKAQFIKSDVGASIFAGSGAATTTGGTKPSALFYGASWYPRYAINSSISVGVPLTFGFSGSANSRTGGSFSIGLDLPIAVDYNFGYGADGNTEDSDAKFGGFAGGGFSYTAASSTDVGSLKSSGPMAHAGVRFPIQETKSITVMASFKLGLGNTKANFFGGTLLYKL